MKSIGPALRAALPFEARGGEVGYAAAFEEAADLLLNHATLFVAGGPHRLTEVEVYWAGPGHEDPFAHKDPIQDQFGKWYFHRQGGTYRGGTFKGVDIAAGESGTFVGILIRSLLDVGTGRFVEGSSTCMEHILARTGHSSVASLAASFDGTIEPKEGSPLFLAELVPGERKEVFASARVGLTLKKGATPERKSFLARPYRFLIEPALIMKGRPQLIATMVSRGARPEDIARVVKARGESVKRYVSAFEEGRKKRPEDFAKELSGADLCALIGSLVAHGY